MELPGTPNDRIGDLRTKKNLSQKELCELAELSPSQLSRIERSEIKNISGDILVKLARALNTSTDYILGLTTIRTPKSYEIGELGLSEGTVKNMLLFKSNGTTPILNRLLEHKHFPLLINQIKSYFHDENALGVMGRNELFDIATASLGDLRKESPEKSADIREGVRFINSEKIGKHEIDIEKIKNTFMTILRDIKKDIDSGNETMADTAPLDMFRQMQSQFQNDFSVGITEEQAASILTEKLAATGIFDEDTMAALKNIAQSAFGKLKKNSEEEAE